LFQDALALGNLIAQDDDSAGGLNSLIANLFLSVGNYILAVSEAFLEVDEALLGSADVIDPGLIRVTISSQDGVVGGSDSGSPGNGSSGSVPEPTSLALMSGGLASLWVTRRRKCQ